MVPRFAKALFVFVGVVAVCLTVLLSALGWKQGFSDYKQYRQVADIQSARERMLIEFTASAERIIFPVVLNEDVAALAVINRITGERMLVSGGRRFLVFPQFSADGERLLVIRGIPSTGHSELLSCTIDDWVCRVLTETETAIHWPVEVRKDVVLYSGSEAFAEGRRYHHDFYLVDSSLQPVRLSTFHFHSLGALNVFDDKIMFDTHGPLGRTDVPFPPRPTALARAKSEILMLQADWKEKRLVIPSQRLEWLYVIDGISSHPTTSPDGATVAFINSRMAGNPWRYNLVVAARDGTIQHYINTTSSPGSPAPAYTGFSRPAIVGHSVLANQLFKDRYETTLVDLSDGSVRPAGVFENTPDTLQSLRHLEIQILK